MSYTPTLTALIDARRAKCRILKDEAKVLFATVSRPFKGRILNSVTDEANVVTDIVPAGNLVLLDTDVGSPEERRATVDRVCQNLPGASIMHLACHGEQDMEDPLESGFLMRDKKLTVSQLMSLKLPPAFLAFLSACETAKGDAKQPDQAIHLAATMLFAGFKSVVATMW